MSKPRSFQLLALLILAISYAACTELSGTSPPYASSRSHELVRLLEAFGDSDCLSTWQLEDVLSLSAYRTVTANGKEQKAVVLVICDLHCLEALFEPFMHAVTHARSGDFSQHLVVAAVGVPAYVYCDHQRARFKHRCVLDRYCHIKDHKKIQFTEASTRYGLATLHKVVWTRAVLSMNYSVFLTDMDVHLRDNPLPYMLKTFPDADMAVSSEFCEAWTLHMFPEGADYVKWKPGDVFEQNSGVYLVNPTQNAFDLFDLWINRTSIKLQAGEWTMDQAILNLLFNRHQNMTVEVTTYLPKPPVMEGPTTTATTANTTVNPTMQTSSAAALPGGLAAGPTAAADAAKGTAAPHQAATAITVMAGDEQRYPKSRTVNVRWEKLNVYRMAFKRFNNYCKGICGCDARTFRQVALRPLHTLGLPPGQAPGGVDACDKTQDELDELLGFHLNCQGNIRIKRSELERWAHGRIVARPPGVAPFVSPEEVAHLRQEAWEKMRKGGSGRRRR